MRRGTLVFASAATQVRGAKKRFSFAKTPNQNIYFPLLAPRFPNYWKVLPENEFALVRSDDLTEDLRSRHRGRCRHQRGAGGGIYAKREREEKLLD
jgi:hypothetical protein